MLHACSLHAHGFSAQRPIAASYSDLQSTHTSIMHCVSPIAPAVHQLTLTLPARVNLPFQHFGMKLSTSDANVIMKAIDTSGDGKADENEFCRMLVRQAKRQWTRKTLQSDLTRILPTHDGVIHPSSDFSRNWDILTLILLIYVGLVTPIEVGFMGISQTIEGVADPAEFYQEQALFWVNRVVDLFFYLDIFVQFRRQYVTCAVDLSTCVWSICLCVSVRACVQIMSYCVGVRVCVFVCCYLHVLSHTKRPECIRVRAS